ncbi:MAG: hypothetical protein K2X27_03615 [Candidatus Obscuribacterales bacterium]|nr:hypothetical protein [Candidatus Obscuribacterales bacterium]
MTVLFEQVSFAGKVYMTFENRSLIALKIGFLAVLTMLIVLAGHKNPQAEVPSNQLMEVR